MGKKVPRDIEKKFFLSYSQKLEDPVTCINDYFYPENVFSGEQTSTSVSRRSTVL